VCYQAGVVPPVYTAQVTVRHDELDRFGRVHPAVYLRYLAHAAVEASTAAGYDAAWYAAAGSMWLVRRSTFELADPARVDERLAIRTWVEDFRRVRSHRRYVVHGTDGRLCMEALTDWVYVDARSGRPRRVPPDLEAAFGAAGVAAGERESWNAPPPPAAPALGSHRVRACEVDTIGHANNAVYLDVAAQATLDVIEDAGWSLDRMIESGGVPVVRRADLEYLEGARYGDRLEIATWFAPSAGALEAHQRIARPAAERPLVRVATRWEWTDPAGAAAVEPPPNLLAALRPLLAA
jgi:acyl-CoA thioester hydrolase